MTKEQKFYKALQDVFIGAKIEGQGGFVNLMKIKSNYYRKIEDILKQDIEEALKKYPKFRDELFDKLYSFFSRYFTESGSIYFNSTPFHNNVYEKVYTDEKDVILFWKTQMLYYVKTDRIFRNLEIESDGFKFYFDVSKSEHKKANEKRNLIYELDKVKEDKTIVFNVYYSEKGRITKTEDILKELKKKHININEEQLERAFRIFEKQSEVDFFINKNAKAFLQEQFKLWSYQYFWEGTPRQTSPATPLQEGNAWSADRVNELQILKDIAFKIIDFISQFEDELVKIWNKPKFVKNSNYVITLDRIKDEKLIEKIFKHEGIKEQIKEWQELGIVDEKFKIEEVFEFPSERGVDAEGGRGVKWNELPFNPDLKKRAKELRKAGNLSEVLFWEQVKNKQFLGFDFDRQKIIGNYIVDFYCKDLGVVVEIDGVSHDNKIEYDKERHAYLESLGLKVIHISDLEIKKNLSGVMEFLKEELKHPVPSGHPSIRGEHPVPSGHPSIRGEHPVPSGHPSIRGEYRHLPIDTKYFKDLELEILNQFEDLDKALDGWLIKSENYQALNTILPKFKEKVQTIYIDPPFNKEQDADYFYSVRYKDSSWTTLLENRIRLAKDVLKDTGSIFVRCDYNGNWIVRPLMNEIFGEENFRNEIDIKRNQALPKTGDVNLIEETENLYAFSKSDKFYFVNQLIEREKPEWVDLGTRPSNEEKNPSRVVEGREFYPPKYRRWAYSQENIDEMYKKDRLKVENDRIKILLDKKKLGSNWTDIPGYSTIPTWGLKTENSEILLKRVIESTSNESDLVMDFFLGSGTTTAVAHKLKRKWLGVEMGEHFYTVVLPRMKKVLAYDKSGIAKEVKEYQGGGFFKYYELEQYEEALANCKYEDTEDIFLRPTKSPYQEYVFMKDEKMLKALEIDYENNKVKVHLSELYPDIDIAETLSNLTGKWIKKISADEVEFEDGTVINTKDLDYKLIKPLIWWR